MTEPAPIATVDAKAIRILLIRLVHCTFEANREFNLKSEEQVTFSFRFDIEREAIAAGRGAVRLTIAAFEDVARAPFRVQVTFEGLFEAFEGHEDGLREYMRYNAIAALVPYLRETISSLSTRAAFPPLVVPPLNVQALADRYDAQSNALSEPLQPE